MRKIATTTCSRARKDGTKTISFKGMALSLSLLLMSVLVSSTSLAQTCPLVCNSGVNVSLPGPAQNCTVAITPEMLFEPPICPNPLTVQLLDNLGLIRSNSPLVTAADIGKTIMYKVIENSSGNSCMGTLTVHDKLPPLLSGCVDATRHCLQDVKPSNEGGSIPVPTAADCSNFSLTYEDIILKGTCLDPYVMLIARRWIAADAKGFASTCTQSIIVTRVSLGGMSPVVPVCPPNRDLTCSTVQPDTRPSATGYPTIIIGPDTYPVIPGSSHLCEFASTYSDEVFPLCGGAFKIFRTWTIFDWCLPNIPGSGNPWTCVQVIKVEDKTPPAITCPSPFVQGTTGGVCFGTAVLPPAAISDACSKFTVQTLTQFGSLNTNGGTLPNIPKGTHTVTYIATDECGNVSNCNTTVTIRDDTPPIAVCIQFSVVSLTREGVATVAASAFSNGSSDNCGLEKFEVRRMANACSPATSFGPTVSFSCCDIGSKVTLVLRVYDTGNNYNECMVEASVQDKIDPTIVQCPPNLTVECGSPEPPPIPPIYFDNCQGATWSNTEVKNISTCGIGTITRVYTVRDASGLTATCTQTIFVVNSTPFVRNDITWPLDYVIQQCGSSIKPEDLPTQNGRPKIIEDPCDIIAVTYTDQILPTNPPACFKVLRKWIVIDWCRYNPNKPVLDTTYFEHIQVIEVRDNVPPTLTCPNDITILSYDSKCGPVPVNVPAATATDCSPTLRWNTTVDYLTNGSVDIIGTSPDMSGNYPLGKHAVTIKAEDQCGNYSNCSFFITVKDGKPPTPICYHGIAAELMAVPSGDGGMVTLKPSMFNSGSYDNCTPDSMLIFTLSKTVFTCANKGHNSIIMYVTDQAGNTDFCETYVLIQDNLNICPSGRTANVGGKISSISGAGMQNVTINVSGPNTQSAMVTTSNTGQFTFNNLAMGKDYTFTPSYNMEPLNGVSTFDLVLITRHILNMSYLDSPYKIIAADVNKSGSVTTMDVVEIRRLILGMTQGFTNNNSWRFVDKRHVFNDPDNPFSPVIPELYNVNNLSDALNSVDFVAIKVGDVNGSAAMSNLSESVGVRNGTGTMAIEIADQKILAGDILRVPVTASQFNKIQGYQFAMKFNTDGLELTDIDYGTSAKENFGLHRLEEGILMTSWDNSKNTTQASDTYNNTTLFTLVFRAKTNSTISKQLRLLETFMPAEAYLLQGKELSLFNLNLEFGKTGAIAADFELFQNNPNPYAGRTVIGFMLPAASQATLTIYDLAGKVVKSVTRAFEQGYNQVQLTADELGSSGVLYYQLETPSHTATRRMVRL